MRMTSTDHPKVHMGPTTDCPHCGGPRTWRVSVRKKTGKQDWGRHCPPCARARTKRWKENNPEKAKAAMDNWRANNIEHVRAYKAKYNAEHVEERRAQGAAWRAKNPGYHQANYQANKARYYAHGATRRVKIRGAANDGWSWAWMQRTVSTGLMTCFVCQDATATEVDHIVPVKHGGGNTFENLGPICLKCNRAKSATQYPGSPGWDEFLQKRRGG